MLACVLCEWQLICSSSSHCRTGRKPDPQSVASTENFAKRNTRIRASLRRAAGDQRLATVDTTRQESVGGSTGLSPTPGCRARLVRAPHMRTETACKAVAIASCVCARPCKCACACACVCACVYLNVSHVTVSHLLHNWRPSRAVLHVGRQMPTHGNIHTHTLSHTPR